MSTAAIPTTDLQSLAADIVSAEFHAKDALRGAVHCCNDLAAAERCRRQHALMMRTMHSGLRALLLALLVQAASLFALFTIGGWDFDSAPGAAAAVLAGLALIDLVQYAVYILIFALLVQAVLSWVNPYSAVAPVFDAMTRTFLRPIRRFVPPLGGVDLSPLVLIVLLQVLLIPLAHLRGLAGGLL